MSCMPISWLSKAAVKTFLRLNHELYSSSRNYGKNNMGQLLCKRFPNLQLKVFKQNSTTRDLLTVSDQKKKIRYKKRK